MMDNKYYDFWLKLNTFLKRQVILASKLSKEEERLGINILSHKIHSNSRNIQSYHRTISRNSGR